MTTATRAKAGWKNRIVRSGEVAPAELIANPRNWRTHPKRQVDALEGALREVGWVQQVIVNERTGRLVDGHARVERALERHEPMVPVLYVDLTEAEEALVLATLDPLGAMAETDQLALESLIADVAVDDAALRALLGDLGKAPAAATEPDDAPDVPPAPWVKTGELYALGDHRVLCGDSTNADDVTRLMGFDAADLIVTDPPYGLDYQRNESQPPGPDYEARRRSAQKAARLHRRKDIDTLTVPNDDLGADATRALVRDAFRAAPLKPGGSFYLFAPPGDSELVFRLALLDAGRPMRHSLVWVKDHFAFGRSDYHYRHESILYGWRAGAAHYFVDDRTLDSVLEFPKPQRSAEHPTMKPVELVERLVTNSSREGEIVYDAFAGAGSTVIAAERTGRRARAIEIGPQYAQVIIERWQAFTGREAVRVAA